MPSFNPFHSVTGRHAASLFDIRLENDFIVFRGNEHESSGQILKGEVVLCLPHAQKIEDVHLRLMGTLRHNSPGSSSQNRDKINNILEHRWAPFIGHHGKSMTLPAGNYEWPFEFTLPGNTSESVEGIPEASITYRLKATVGRGKLAYDLHAYKHIRVIRTLEPGALELLHAMSVENIWPNKVDYSIVIPQKAVVFGGTVDLEMRLTPLLKGLEMGRVTATFVETRELCIVGPTGLTIREHKMERDVKRWMFEVTREDHWQDMIEESGQEGWVVSRKLELPTRLRHCIQDANVHGIKVRHKVKLTIALKNPDGHTSELRAALPISLFISPNMPLDEQGDVVNQGQGQASTANDLGSAAPPGYNDHHLDRLYEDVDMTGFQTPAIQSGLNSPFYHSRAGSVENLAAIAHSAPITPAALSSRLADVSSDPTQRDTIAQAVAESQSMSLTRSNSGEESSSGRRSPERVDITEEEFAELNKVPSYTTALRTPARSRAQSNTGPLPDYQTALTTPTTPPNELPPAVIHALTTITEGQVSQSST